MKSLIPFFRQLPQHGSSTGRLQSQIVIVYRIDPLDRLRLPCRGERPSELLVRGHFKRELRVSPAPWQTMIQRGFLPISVDREGEVFLWEVSEV